MKKTIILILTHVGCLCLGFWIFMYAYTEFILKTELETKICHDITMGCIILESINSGNLEMAKITLESQIDGGLIGLSTFESIDEIKHKDMVIDSLKLAKNHRSKFPRVDQSVEIQTALNRALSLLGQNFQHGSERDTDKPRHSTLQ